MATHRKIMKDEYGPAMNWYRCAMQNLNLEDEKNANLDPILHGPSLMIVARDDPLSNALAVKAMKVNAENLKVVEISSGHWVQIEKKDEVNTTLEEFFQGVDEEL